jgi:hypothetical protein
VTPLRRSALLGGKTLAALVVGVLQVAAMFAIGHFLFGLDLGNDLPALFVLTVAVVLSAVCHRAGGGGLSHRARHQHGAHHQRAAGRLRLPGGLAAARPAHRQRGAAADLGDAGLSGPDHPRHGFRRRAAGDRRCCWGLLHSSLDLAVWQVSTRENRRI